MAITFPTSLDALSNPIATDGLTGHAEQHANVNDAIEALEAKVGINSSADTSSLDYKVAHAIQSSEKGAVNGVAPLGADSKVPSAYLPSYVDDVVEVANYAALPGAGESGKIYITVDNNKQFRWSGSVYVELTASPGTTDAVPEGTTNLYFTAQRVRDAVLTGLSLASSAAISATDSVLSALGKLQAQVSGKQDTLVSGTNIKTVNGSSVLGSGDLVISGGLTLGTAQATTSGTSKDFTGIPDWVKKITLSMSGVSTNGSSNVMVQIGDAGGIENTGYMGYVISAGGTDGAAFSSGFLTQGVGAASHVRYGHVVLTLIDAATNLWAFSNMVANTVGTAYPGGGTKSLSGTLDRIRLTTANGTDTFDAGSVNILYE